MAFKVAYSRFWSCYVAPCSTPECPEAVTLTGILSTPPEKLTEAEKAELLKAADAALCDTCKQRAINV